MSACEDRGADLLLAARGGEAPGDLRAHLAACPACREELESLRPFARALTLAHGGIRPRPATREALLRAVRGEPGDALTVAAALPPRRGRILPLWVPAAAVIAAGTAGIWIALRPPGTAPRDGAPAGAAPVEILDLFGAEASRPAGLRLGAPVHADVVLGAGARIRVPAGGAVRREIEVLAGAAFVDPTSPPDPAAGPLLARAGAVAVEDRGGRFSVEFGPGGTVLVTVETGVVVVRAGGVERAVSGPCRVAVPPSGPPGEPARAEPTDATAWFAYPDLALALRGRDLVLEMRPSVPREIRIAPFHRFDPLFSLLVEHPERGQASIPIGSRMLRPPPPPEGGPDGAFLLGPRKPYTIVVDAGALGLARGRYRLRAVYSAGRPGGLWRGTRTSNEVDLEVP